MSLQESKALLLMLQKYKKFVSVIIQMKKNKKFLCASIRLPLRVKPEIPLLCAAQLLLST